jgi:hypothetical protein
VFPGRRSPVVVPTPRRAKHSRAATTAWAGPPWGRIPSAGPDPQAKTLGIPGASPSRAPSRPGTSFSQVNSKGLSNQADSLSAGWAKNSERTTARLKRTALAPRGSRPPCKAGNSCRKDRRFSQSPTAPGLLSIVPCPAPIGHRLRTAFLSDDAGSDGHCPFSAPARSATPGPRGHRSKHLAK